LVLIEENARTMAINPNKYENMTGSLKKGCRKRAAICNIFSRHSSVFMGWDLSFSSRIIKHYWKSYTSTVPKDSIE